MSKDKKNSFNSAMNQGSSKPSLAIRKIGVVARDYGFEFPNGYRDFSHSLPDILNLLDEKGCDAVLFSLYSIINRDGYNPKKLFDSLNNIKAIFLEEFLENGEARQVQRYVVYYRTESGWEEYVFHQIFGSLIGNHPQKIHDFAKDEMPKRILGNFCILLCGETNGVKYSKGDQKIHDIFGLRDAIPSNVTIVLNPIHDRMTRFEMKLKRQFLSENNRWVISVWNKGRKDKNGKVRDGQGPAWTLYHNGNEGKIDVEIKFGVEIGIVDIN